MASALALQTFTLGRKEKKSQRTVTVRPRVTRHSVIMMASERGDARAPAGAYVELSGSTKQMSSQITTRKADLNVNLCNQKASIDNKQTGWGKKGR